MNAKQLFFFFLLVFSSFILKAQTFNGTSAVQLGANTFNTSLNSGIYIGEAVQAGHPIQNNSKYLFVMKRAYNNAMQQFQISTGTYETDRVFFRKINVPTGNPINSTWHEFATRGVNIFTGSQRVNGTVYANKVTVQATTWADFVFEDDYELPSLDEVANHIKENKHLPGIPSAKEVEENGICLGDMNAKLLQKIEELTLYVIDLKAKVEKLEAK